MAIRINKQAHAVSAYRKICIVLLLTLSTIGIGVAWLEELGMSDIGNLTAYGGIPIAIIYGLFVATAIAAGCMLWHYTQWFKQFTRYQTMVQQQVASDLNL